jgi:hypothetical protein
LRALKEMPAENERFGIKYERITYGSSSHLAFLS